MRRIVLGLVMVMAFAGVARAGDFVVVNSTDPAFRPGQSFDAGAHVRLSAGSSLTLVRTSGEVTILKGAPNGVVLPNGGGPQNPASFDALQAMFSRPPSGRAFGARRGFCPGADALMSMESILTAYQRGCQTEARDALKAYLKAQGVLAPPTVATTYSAAPPRSTSATSTP
jgi:hypothetical protein